MKIYKTKGNIRSANYVLFLDLGDCYKDTSAYVIIHGAIHLGAFFCLYVNVNILLL